MSLQTREAVSGNGEPSPLIINNILPRRRPRGGRAQLSDHVRRSLLQLVLLGNDDQIKVLDNHKNLTR